MKLEVNGVQYTRYGSGFLRRSGPQDDWADVAQDDVPAAFFEEETRVRVRKDTGSDPYRPEPAEGEIIGNRRAGAVRKPNPKLDAIAEELGLTPFELRQRLNDNHADGTRVRVDETRFDAIASELNMTPAELRDRFAGRLPEQR